MEKDQGNVDMKRPGVGQKKREQGREGKQHQAERRDLLQKVLLGAAAVACATFALERNARASTPDAGGDMARPLDAPKGLAEGNILERMRHDLLRALKKPVSERKWVMIIDQQKCIGCCACNLSCNTENNLPPGVVYRPVLRQEVGKYPNVRRIFTPKPCMHCDNPPCVPVCPVKATWKTGRRCRCRRLQHLYRLSQLPGGMPIQREDRGFRRFLRHGHAGNHAVRNAPEL